MAITLFCYSTYEKEELKDRLALISKGSEELFLNKFLVGNVSETSPMEQDITVEYGKLVRTKFLIALNDKSAAALVQSIPILLKAALGEDKVIVFFENEKIM